jgi:cell division protein FtsQ
MRRPARQRTQPPYRRSDAVRRRRNRRRPNYLLLFCIFAVVATISGSITYALTTPNLNVAKVEVKGVQLANTAAIEKSGSKAVGKNILLVRTSPMIREVRGLSEVKTVKMGRKFPNRLWLRVWEREPAAALVSNGGFYLVESDGFVFHRLDKQPVGVPLIHVTGGECLKPGRFASSPGIRCAMQVVRLARRDEIKLAKISVDPVGRICLNMGSDFRVFLGYPDEIARKMSKLRNALARKPSMVRDGTYIDLSCPTAPAWRPKTAPPTAS